MDARPKRPSNEAKNGDDDADAEPTAFFIGVVSRPPLLSFAHPPRHFHALKTTSQKFATLLGQKRELIRQLQR